MSDKVIYDSEGFEVKAEKTRRRTRFSRKIEAVMPILALLAFLLLGFNGYWHPGWVVFLSVPFTSIFLGIFRKTGKALWTSLSVIVSVVGYFVLGFAFGLWHPGWLIFFLIPIVAILSD